MKTLIPWDMADPKRHYTSSVATDIRKTFAAVRKKQLRQLELKRRHELKNGKRK